MGNSSNQDALVQFIALEMKRYRRGASVLGEVGPLLQKVTTPDQVTPEALEHLFDSIEALHRMSRAAASIAAGMEIVGRSLKQELDL